MIILAKHSNLPLPPDCQQVPQRLRRILFITARNSSLWEGNVFTGICLFIGGGGRYQGKVGERYTGRVAISYPSLVLTSSGGHKRAVRY